MRQTEGFYYYRAFSLGVRSELPLPELSTALNGTEISIGLEAPFTPSENLGSERCISANHNEVHLFWEHAGSFLIKGGTEIIVRPVPNAEEALLRTGVLGPGFATLLQQRGDLVLHASAIGIAGRAIAFVGWKGQGKSTLAAALFAQGWPLITDDLLALNCTDQPQVLAHPGFPQLKLWPDSAEHSLGESPLLLPKLMPDYEKRVRSVTTGFAPEPMPLRAIYSLADGPEFALHRLSPHDAFKQIVSNTFCARYGSQVFKGKTGAAHLQNVAKVAAVVPVFRLERPSSLSKLRSLADFVSSHARLL